MMLVMVLLAATADLSRAEEEKGASESPPSPPPAKDWSKTASGHGGVKLNPASAWTQYVMAGDVFYIRDDDWSSRIDTPVRSLVAACIISLCRCADRLGGNARLRRVLALQPATRWMRR